MTARVFAPCSSHHTVLCASILYLYLGPAALLDCIMGTSTGPDALYELDNAVLDVLRNSWRAAEFAGGLGSYVEGSENACRPDLVEVGT